MPSGNATHREIQLSARPETDRSVDPPNSAKKMSGDNLILNLPHGGAPEDSGVFYTQNNNYSVLIRVLY